MTKFLRALKSGWAAAVAVSGGVITVAGALTGYIPASKATTIAVGVAGAILAVNDKLSPAHPDATDQPKP